MHESTARNIAVICLVITLALIGYVGGSYWDARQRFMEEGRLAGLRLEQSRQAVVPPTLEERYVPPAPIVYPFY